MAMPAPVVAGAAELSAWTGGPRPEFTLPALNGAAVTLGAQHGDAVLVHFFATWCEPCREELPALARLAQRSRIVVVPIATDESDVRVRRFVEATAVKMPVLLDRDRAVAKAWKVSILPTTFVLNSKLEPKLVVESDYAWDRVDPIELIDSISSSSGRLQPQRRQTVREDDNVFQ